jgi:GntR family transcriptional regulator
MTSSSSDVGRLSTPRPSSRTPGADPSRRTRRSLPDALADELRARLNADEWAPGERLPTEAQLVRSSGLSRATVRQAMKTLESEGLITVRRGLGTFRAAGARIQIGMQELASITETIAAQGHRPGMRYRSVRLRAPSARERETLGCEPDEAVLDVQRAFLADERIVAYGYDLVPGSLLPADFQPEEMTGSIFGFLEQRAGVRAVRALAEVHAVESDDIAWADDDDDRHLYILLDQVHYDTANRPLMHSRLFFVEGRFRLVVVRTRTAAVRAAASGLLLHAPAGGQPDPSAELGR